MCRELRDSLIRRWCSAILFTVLADSCCLQIKQGLLGQLLCRSGQFRESLRNIRELSRSVIHNIFLFRHR